MSKEKEAKMKALQLTLDKMEKSYGKGTVMRLGDKAIENVEASEEFPNTKFIKREEIKSDRAALQRIHSFPEYQSVVNAFQNGEVTAIYDLTYQGTHTPGKKEVITNVPEWISRFGHKTKDSISTKAFIGKIQDIPVSLGMGLGIGIIIRGYPVLVSPTDVYSQTHSASPKGLIDHQVGSGFAKRGDTTNAIYSMEDWLYIHDEHGVGKRGIAEEAILDNWRIVGAVVSEDMFDQVGREELGIDQLDIPVHVVSSSGTYKGLI